MNATLTRSRLIGHIMRRNLGNAVLACLVLGWAAFFWSLTYLGLVYLFLFLDKPQEFHAMKECAAARIDRFFDAARKEYEAKTVRKNGMKPDACTASLDETNIGKVNVGRAIVSFFRKPFELLSPTGKYFLAGSLAALAGIGFACRHVFFFSVREEPPPFFFKSARFGNGGWGGFGMLAIPLIAPLATYWGCHFFRSMVFPWPNRIGDACKAYRILGRSDAWRPYPALHSQRRAVDLLASLGLVRISNRFGKREVKASTPRSSC